MDAITMMFVIKELDPTETMKETSLSLDVNYILQITFYFQDLEAYNNLGNMLAVTKNFIY